MCIRDRATSSLSIFGDHQDVMAARQTGFAMLCEGSVQEVMDLSGVAHLTAIKKRMPFLNFFDGFRVSHELQKVEVIEQEELAKLIDYEALEDFRNSALNPNHPVTRGTAQNPDAVSYTHLGNMISASNKAIDLQKRPWLWMPPGACMVITVMAVNLFGDALRDALDPKKRR